MSHLSVSPLPAGRDTNLAERFGIEALLNCVVREWALPRGAVRFEPPGDRSRRDGPAALERTDAPLLRLLIGEAELVVAVDRRSRLGRCRFASDPFGRTRRDTPWRALDLERTATLLLQAMEPDGDHAELVRQIRNSGRTTAAFLRARGSVAPPGADSLRASEQFQVWGHALHPAPKSRDGVSTEALLDASPEVGAAVSLFWFAVHPAVRSWLGRDRSALLERIAGAPDLHPCHPWEATRLLADPVMHQLEREGLVVPVGTRGMALFPTSSVRTLYHPDLDSFLKLSIHVRLTNCVRKNAWYELESAVSLSALLRPCFREIEQAHLGFRVLLEPSAASLDLSGHAPPDDARRIGESFGILFRDAIPAAERDESQPRVAMSLFTWGADGPDLTAATALLGGVDAAPVLAAERWLRRFVSLLAGGVLRAHLQHGIVLEPHLQNVLVGTGRDGLPVQVWVRDLEGTKLVRGGAVSRFPHDMRGRVLESVLYDAHAGWRRTVYCLLVNSIAEAVFHLAIAAGIDEDRLWLVVQAALDRVRARLDADGVDTAPLRALLAGVDWPAKTNLLTRLNRLPDRQSGSVFLRSPFAVPPADAGAVA